MKGKELLKVIAISLALLTTSALGCGSAIQVYSESEQVIDVHVGQQFIIALESNPTTGYQWEVQFDDSLLKLAESKFEPSEEAKSGTLGAGGRQKFTFKGLRQGKTCVTLVYKRPWEEHPIQQRIFTVHIK